MKMVVSSKEKNKNEGNFHNAKFMNKYKTPRDNGRLATTQAQGKLTLHRSP